MDAEKQKKDRDVARMRLAALAVEGVWQVVLCGHINRGAYRSGIRARLYSVFIGQALERKLRHTVR